MRDKVTLTMPLGCFIPFIVIVVLGMAQAYDIIIHGVLGL